MNTIIDITKFCENKSGCRPYLQSPFNYENMTCACNGHAIIMTKKTGEYPPLANEALIKIGKIIDAIKKATFSPAGKITLPKQVTCTTCKGTGKATVKQCKECLGEGEVSFVNRFNSYGFCCQSCDGDGHTVQAGGDTNCQDCLGTGSTFEKAQHIQISGVLIQCQYAQLITNQPGLQISADASNHQLHFKFSDYSGVIMGMTQ